MALDAKIGSGRVRQHFRILGAMSAMTAQTIQFQVLVSGVGEFIPDGMGRMGLPLMALAAQGNDALLGEEESIVRRMRIMAGGAFAFLNRRMLGRGVFLPPDGVAVTLAADFQHRSLEQVITLARVGVVAIQTAISLRHRPVEKTAAENCVDLLVMAGPAQLVAGVLCAKGMGRFGIIVALPAHPLGHRRMHVVIENRLLVGTVGIMAHDARGFLHRISHVDGGERSCIDIMTFLAQGRRVGLQQEITACRAVRVMTVQAAGDRRMGILEVLDRRGDVLVATEAELIPFFEQVVLVIGGVRIVAEHALALGHRIVAAARLAGDHRAVTGGTDLVLRGRQHLAMIRGMGIVAPRAIAALDRRMHELLLELAREIHMALQADLAPRPGFEVEIRVGGRFGDAVDDQKDKENGQGGSDDSGSLLHRDGSLCEHAISSP